MNAQLVLQLPVNEAGRKALVVAACDDPNVISEFATRMLEASEASVDRADDPFEREYARIRLEQLRARLHFALESDSRG